MEPPDIEEAFIEGKMVLVKIDDEYKRARITRLLDENDKLKVYLVDEGVSKRGPAEKLYQCNNDSLNFETLSSFIDQDVSFVAWLCITSRYSFFSNLLVISK